MKTKIETISSKLIILLILMIFSGLFIAFFLYSKIDRIKQNNELLNNVNSLKINLSNLDQEVVNIIKNEQYNISFYKNSNNNSLITIRKYFDTNKKLTGLLVKNRHIIKNQTLYDKCLKIQENQDSYIENYELLIVNLIDRGFQNFGKTGEITDLQNQINEQLSRVDDFMLSEIIKQASTSVKNYVNTLSNPAGIQSISFIDQISYSLYSIPAESNVDIDNVTKQIEKIKNLINQVQMQNIEIGLENNGGILLKLNTVSDELTEGILNVTDILNDYLPKQNAKVTNQALIIVLIITLLMALFIVSILQSFIKPVNIFSIYLNKLTKGALPEEIVFERKDEFSEIGAKLNHIVEGIKHKTEFATELGKGNLTSKYKSLSDEDILGNALQQLQKSLQKAAEEDKKHNVENERRRWSNEGLAKFSEILRMNNDNTEMLCDSVIKNLVKYLNASVGGIYLYNDENKNDIHLYLASVFAYDRKKFESVKISLGEGLIGACAQEKQMIYMTEIPEDYLVITSGLGDANPNILLIVPLNLENQVLGVLEIASFNKLEKHELEFVEKLAESIASTLASAKINERTQQLLEKSQKQAVEMAEQEEEMRQNMEELQATQEESSRRENDMSGILNALNSTSYYFETDMDGIITAINDRMLFILEMQREHVIGMHHSELSAVNKNSPEYISFWNEIREGSAAVTKIQKYESATGNEVWLKQNYTTIFNKDGLPVKTVCICSDISELVQLEKDIQKQERELSAKSAEINDINSAVDSAYIRCIINNEGLITDANTNLEKLTGYAKKELLSKKIRDILPSDQVKSFERIWENIVNGHPFYNVIKFTSTSGENKLVKSIFKPILSDKKTLLKVIFLGEAYGSSMDTEDKNN